MPVCTWVLEALTRRCSRQHLPGWLWPVPAQLVQACITATTLLQNHGGVVLPLSNIDRSSLGS